MAVEARIRADKSSENSRTAVLVLGMHRSGTSALSRVLSLLGCGLPHTLTAGDTNNEHGYWESGAIQLLNDELFQSAGTDWSDWQPINRGWFSSPLHSQFRERARETLEQEYGSSPLFVVKDPRICKVPRFWIDVVKDCRIRPLVIVPIRNPLDVGTSLLRRDGFPVAYSVLLWLRHVLEAELGSRDEARMFCSYEQLMKNWRLIASKAEETLQLSWPRFSISVDQEVSASLRPDLRHHQDGVIFFENDPAISRWVRDVYNILLRWAEQGEDINDRVTLDAIKVEFDAASQPFGQLALISRQLTSEAAKLRDELKVNQERYGQKLAEVAQAHEAELQHLESGAEQRILELQGQLLQIQNTLADRSVEVKEATEALARANRGWQEDREQLEELISERTAVKQELETARHEMLRLGEDLKTAYLEITTIRSISDLELTQLKDQLSQTQSALAQRRAEADEVSEMLSIAKTELQDARERQVKFEEDISALNMQLTRVMTENERISAENASLEGQNKQWIRDSATLTSKLVEVEDKISALTASSELEEERHKAEIHKLEKERVVLQAKLMKHFDEISILTKFLKESEQKERALREESTWLSDIAQLLSQHSRSRRSTIYNLLPFSWVWSIRHKQLRDHGLFDKDAYLQHYPDVRASGMDPLLHYLQYGAKEGRRGIWGK